MISIEQKIEIVKNMGFITTYVDFEGAILDNFDKKLRCFIEAERENIEFRKYFELSDGSRFYSSISVPPQALVDDPTFTLGFILESLQRTYERHFKL